MTRKLIPLIMVLALFVTSCSKKQNSDSTLAQTLSQDFEETVKANKKMSMEALAKHLVGNKANPFSGAVMPVTPGYLNGFSSEIEGFTKGACFGPIIGSIPFIGYVFTVEGNPEQFMKTLKDKADLRWNICTEADEMIVNNVDNIVFFVMAPTNLDEDEF